MGFRGRYRNRRDANEPVLVDQFRAMGVTVHRLDTPVDLMCGFLGGTHAVEIKREGEDLNDKQRKFAATWRGDLTIVRTIQDVRDTVDQWRAEADHA